MRILAGVSVYMPTYILNQSEIIIMFESGAGVEVVENEGFMTARVYLPWTFMVCIQERVGHAQYIYIYTVNGCTCTICVQ
jgi:hypothetical protein